MGVPAMLARTCYQRTATVTAAFGADEALVRGG